MEATECPPARCSFCGEVWTRPLQKTCIWCFASPTLHHPECCPTVNVEIRNKLRKKQQESDHVTEDNRLACNNIPPKRARTSLTRPWLRSDSYAARPPYLRTGTPALAMDDEAEAEGTLHLPREYCQLSITHPAYSAPSCGSAPKWIA